MEQPTHECPRCGRNQWQDLSGFGSFEPTWGCGYCGLPAETKTPKGKE